MLNSTYFTGRTTLLFGNFSFYLKEDLVLAITYMGGQPKLVEENPIDIIIYGSSLSHEEFVFLETKYPKAFITHEGKIDDFLQEFDFGEEVGSTIGEIIMRAKAENFS